MSNGVMAALQILVLSVQVRVLVGQQELPARQLRAGFFAHRGGLENEKRRVKSWNDFFFVSL